MSVNKICLLGNVGSEPKMNTFADGSKVANFSLATTDTWTDKKSQEKKESTQWHSISVFGGLANIVEQYVVKGSKLYLEGKMVYEKYTDKETGIEKIAPKVKLQGFNSILEMIGKSESKPATVADVKKHIPEAEVVEEDLDFNSIPF